MIVTVVAAAVLVTPGMHCSLAVGAATDVFVGVVATVAASDSGAAIVDFYVVAVVAGAVAAWVATWFLSSVVLSTPLFVQYKHALLHLFCHYPSTSCSRSIRQRFVLRAHACTFVHVGLITFDIWQVDLFLA